ncbi:hypothetical protein FB567DRAFT_107812 [Paraphoma chrysanthemicola]|uniref:Uncharacterized protein n=1 Tax=Paraphoma chrysanthemicola TaxID=798071 RepID=A0A8K0R235_9PLEO|nr:hypothetical protein FB567DRAFT_107812 [Paraphoma chrysanthemicola]
MRSTIIQTIPALRVSSGLGLGHSTHPSTRPVPVLRLLTCILNYQQPASHPCKLITMTDNTRAPPSIEHDRKRIVVGKTLKNELVHARWTPMNGSIGKPNYTKTTGETLRFADIDRSTIPKIILENTPGMAVTTSAQLTKAAVPIWLEATGQDPASWGKKEGGAENGLSRAKARKGKGKDGGRAAVSGVRKPFTILNAKKKPGKKDAAKYLKMFNNLNKEPSVKDMAQIQLATASARPRLEIPTLSGLTMFVKRPKTTTRGQRIRCSTQSGARRPRRRTVWPKF